MSKYEGKKKIKFNRKTTLYKDNAESEVFSKDRVVTVNLQNHQEDNLIGETVDITDGLDTFIDVPIECFNIEE